MVRQHNQHRRRIHIERHQNKIQRRDRNRLRRTDQIMVDINHPVALQPQFRIVRTECQQTNNPAQQILSPCSPAFNAFQETRVTCGESFN